MRTVSLLLVAAATAVVAHASVSAQAPGSAGMVRIPTGSYMPLYAKDGRVSVAAFRIDAKPVTQAQYNSFRRVHGSTEAADRPATRMTRIDARAFCAAQGKRLPSIDEWEYVAGASRTARGAGNEAAFRQEILDRYTRARDPRAAVGSTFRNAFGVWDMHGLVWEWVEPSAAHAGHTKAEHDMSCAGSASGATSTTDYAAFLRFAFRSGLDDDSAGAGLGFRCAADA